VIHTGSRSDCRCDGDGPAQCTNGAQQLKTVRYAAQAVVRVEANVASMRFEPVHGTVTNAGTVCVVAQNGNAIHQVVSIVGRVRACTPRQTFGPCEKC
jgi:type IV fimbrial biogenesis protein FimT